MRRIYSYFLLIATTLTFMSCAEGYNITGTSLQSIFDGNTVYLRTLDDDRAVDSCKILHGKFTMSGAIDSVMCVRLFIGNDIDNIPIILEKGNIMVSTKDASIKVEGTPLNDKFYAFMMERDSLNYLLMELPRKESSMILEGYDHDEILRQLGEEEANIRVAIDKMETDFITENYNNVLGITYFLVLCNNAYNQFGFPTTTPQIDEIYGRAPESFRQNKSVVEYMNMCEGR